MLITKCDICGVETSQPLYKNDLGIVVIKEEYVMDKIAHGCAACQKLLDERIQEIHKRNRDDRLKEIKEYINTLRNEKYGKT